MIETKPTETDASNSPEGVQFPDLDWFIAHFEEIVAQYPDHWLCVRDQQVVAHAATVAQLRRQLDELNIRDPFIARSHPDAWASYKSMG